MHKIRWKGEETYHKLHLRVFPNRSRRRARRRELAKEVTLGTGRLNNLRRTISETVANTNKINEDLERIEYAAFNTARAANNALAGLDRVLTEFKGDADVFVYFRNPPTKNQLRALTDTLLEIAPSKHEVETIKFIEPKFQLDGTEMLSVVRIPISVKEEDIVRNITNVLRFLPPVI